MDDYLIRYKYLPFNLGTLEVLKKGTIKFSDPFTFNDPFDCLPYFDTSAIDDINKTNPKLIANAYAQMSGSPAKKIAQLNRNKRLLKIEMDNGIYLEKLLKNVGILSLSKTESNILMWSHYADHHKGFVVGFKIPVTGYEYDSLKFISNLTPFEVLYNEIRPVIKIGQEAEIDTINKVLLTKSKLWKYEKEERVIDRYRGPGIHKYNRNEILHCVIAGAKMEDDDFSTLVDVVKSIAPQCKSTVNLFKAKINKKKYCLDMVKIT